MDGEATKSAVCWVPQGAAATNPQYYSLTEDDKAAINSLREEQKKRELKPTARDEFDMEHYDDNEEHAGSQFMTTMYTDFLSSIGDKQLNAEVPDSDEDEAEKIRETDMLLVSGNADTDLSSLEVYVFDADTSALYVHHDYIVGSFPLGLCWLNSRPDKGEMLRGNLVAMASFEPVIEVWDLDVIDQLEPVLALGVAERQSPSSKSHKRRLTKDAHKEAVLCLDRNPHEATVICSGSADNAVKVWDLNAGGQVVVTLRQHRDKVQSLQWHPDEKGVLATAGYDRRICLLNAAAPSDIKEMSIPADAEQVVWSAHDRHVVLASSEDGMITAFDTRREDKPLWCLQAHNKAVTGVTASSLAGVLVSCSLDRTAKVWDVRGGTPSFVLEKELHAGPLFSLSANPDVPNILGLGGTQVVVWDLEESNVFCRCFGRPLPDEE